jgi:hypothetical protein
MGRLGYGELEAGAETAAAQAFHPQGALALPGLSFSGDSNTGWYLQGEDSIGEVVGGVEQFRSSSGVFSFRLSTTISSTGTLTITAPTITTPTIASTGWALATHAHAANNSGGTIASATLAATVTVIDSTDTSAFVALFDSATGSLAVKTDGGLTYNAGTGMLTATGFTGPLTGNASGSSGSTTGNAATATALQTARTIGGTSFDGTGNIAVGLAATATALASARTIGGVSFDGTGNINLPGVNTAGNQATSGLAATATLAATTTALASARNIGGVSFDGTGNIDLPGVNSSGNQNTSGNAATVTTNANLTGHVTSSGNAAVLGSFSSSQLKAALSDETGSGAAVFATSPTLVTPALGTPASGNLTNCTNAGKTAGFIIAMS